MRIEIDTRIPQMWENVNGAVQIMMQDIANLVQNNAKINAPYLSWTLQKSISTDFNKIQKWIAVVWSDVKYAKVREYVNNKNPQTKHYLKRWYTEHKTEIKEIIKEALDEKLK